MNSSAEWRANEASNAKQPVLSLIIGARNDEYMGDFKWRFETSVNYLASNLQKLGRMDDVEVVVTDWGSEIPLHTVLKLNPLASRLLRFVVVPPELAREKQGDSEFPIVLVQNTAVQRCRGEFIAQTDSDILFPIEYLKKLFEILDSRRIQDRPLDECYVVSKRRHIPWEYVNRSPGISEMDRFIRWFGRQLPLDVVFNVPNLGTYAGTAFVMIPKFVWHEYRGYDERLVHYGFMDIDFALRVTKKYPLIFLEELGMLELYHLEHYPSLTRFRPPRPRNPANYDPAPRPNGEDWGLAGYALDEFRAEAVEDSELMPSGQAGALGMAMSSRYVALALWRKLRSELHWYLPWLARLWRHRMKTIVSALASQPVHRWPARGRQLFIDWRRRHQKA